MKVLNPILYHALQRRFGYVRVGQAGCSAMMELSLRPDGSQHWVPKHGEAYYVNCPFCRETRKRLHISHLWCVRDDEKHTSHRSYIHCFNTDGACTRNPYNVDSLIISVFGEISASQFQNKANLNLPAAREKPLETELPGTIVSLKSLPMTHSANQYVLSRGYDPTWLVDTYGVGYCSDAVAPYLAMQHRLYIPVVYGGKLAGWQGRYLSTIDFKKTNTPKYYTYRYMDSDVMYNFDVARRYDIIVAVEGVTKVWNIGPQAIAYFGVMTPARARMLSQVLKPNGRLVFMPDGDAWKADPNTGVVKAIRMLQTLQQCIPPDKIVPLQLPDGVDPGDLREDINRMMILDGLAKAGWTGDYDAYSDVDHTIDLFPRRRYVAS